MNPNPELPEDIILAEILPRLPAKSLVRFKSVCRQWKTFISSVEFSKTHLHHPSFLSSTRRSILTHGYSGDKRLFEAVDYYDANADSNNLYLTNFGEQCTALFKQLELSASCNGLAFLIASPIIKKHRFVSDYDRSYEFSYVIYNPVLGVGDYVEIPHPRWFPLGSAEKGFIDMLISRHYNFGFGYDSKSDDYYIVAVDLPGDFKIVFYVYSLRSHRWEPKITRLGVKNNVSRLSFESIWKLHGGTLVKETLHWGMSLGHDYNFILAYSLATRNEAKKMYLPQPKFGNTRECGGGGGIDFSLCCLGGCLCAWANYNDSKEGIIADMWMMKEYGVRKSWTKLFRIKLDDTAGCENFFGFTKSGKVLVFTSLHETFLVDFTCDLLPKISGHVFENENWWPDWAVDYNPSLVSVLAIISGL